MSHHHPPPPTQATRRHKPPPNNQQPPQNLLQQHGVVALEGLEDVVVAAQRAEAVDRRVAVPAARLAAHVERVGRVRRRVRLEAGADGGVGGV